MTNHHLDVLKKKMTMEPYQLPQRCHAADCTYNLYLKGVSSVIRSGYCRSKDF